MIPVEHRERMSIGHELAELGEDLGVAATDAAQLEARVVVSAASVLASSIAPLRPLHAPIDHACTRRLRALERAPKLAHDGTGLVDQVGAQKRAAVTRATRASRSSAFPDGRDGAITRTCSRCRRRRRRGLVPLGERGKQRRQTVFRMLPAILAARARVTVFAMSAAARTAARSPLPLPRRPDPSTRVTSSTMRGPGATPAARSLIPRDAANALWICTHPGDRGSGSRRHPAFRGGPDGEIEACDCKDRGGDQEHRGGAGVARNGVRRWRPRRGEARQGRQEPRCRDEATLEKERDPHQAQASLRRSAPRRPPAARRARPSAR